MRFLVTILIMSIIIFSKNTPLDEDTIQSVRQTIGEENLLSHTRGQIRLGLLQMEMKDQKGLLRTATGAHFHIDTKRFAGMRLGAMVYGVVSSGDKGKMLSYFGGATKGFVSVSEFYLEGDQGPLGFRLGRQMLDTPHFDSDDIRMMPNFFEAYRVWYENEEVLRLEGAWVRRAGGWGNGDDPAKFVYIGKTLGIGSDSQGAYLSARYKKAQMRGSLWWYIFGSVDMFYADWESKIHTPFLNAHLAFQYDRVLGDESAGVVSSSTWGVSFLVHDKQRSWRVQTAYNKETKGGATPLFIGGGALYTSMENSSLDMVAGPSSAWTVAMHRSFDLFSLDGGVSYGVFCSEVTGECQREFDATAVAQLARKVSLELVYADTTSIQNDRIQTLRLILNIDF